ncbi:hypothetical protein OIU77_006705 [Salix suchowensis]|uniref:XYLOGLUCAN ENDOTRANSGLUCOSYLASE/HYDROLASE PROTEIN 9 n=2 Tax=Salix TaxID=40685 RepID=A0A9Q0VCM7_SALPP|nr:hypothetical protein OIU77_006705 [Salix suchowensis]KAJ6745148.1 XYLOGLUCAN ENDOTRANSGLUCOSYLASE/HYDROLASE PROTEIN 9 [Salix purpurea]
MAVSVFKVLGFFVGFFLIVGLVSSAKFDELFQPSWALDHFAYEGELLRLKLDNYSGAGFQSKSKYMFGKVTVQIKLVVSLRSATESSLFPLSVQLFFLFPLTRCRSHSLTGISFPSTTAQL